MDSQVFIQRPKHYQLDEKIFYLDIYHPYYGGTNSNFNNFSKLILDLKDKRITAFRQRNKQLAVGHFFNELNPILGKGFPIVTIPSSDPLNIDTGTDRVVSLLANQGRTNANSCLRRHTKVEKKANGGNRNIDIELNSITVDSQYQHLIQGQTVLLLDDITTTGNSFRACEKLLLDAGAFKVIKLALGKTVSY